MFDRDEQEISQIIDNGLEAIRAGRATLDQVLEQHPLQAEAIRPELEAGLWLVGKRKEVDARPGFVAASRKRVLERIQAEARSQGAKHAFFGFAWPRRPLYRLAAAISLLIMLLTGFGGTLTVSQTSLPGQNLYAVKRASEQVAYSVTLDEVDRVELSAQFADRRLDESEVLITIGEYSKAQYTLQDYEQSIHQTLTLLQQASNTNPNESGEVEQAAVTVQQGFEKNAVHLSAIASNVKPREGDAQVKAQLQTAVVVSIDGASAASQVYEKLQNSKPKPGVAATATAAPSATAKVKTLAPVLPPAATATTAPVHNVPVPNLPPPATATKAPAPVNPVAPPVRTATSVPLPTATPNPTAMPTAAPTATDAATAAPTPTDAATTVPTATDVPTVLPTTTDVPTAAPTATDAATAAPTTVSSVNPPASVSSTSTPAPIASSPTPAPSIPPTAQPTATAPGPSLPSIPPALPTPGHVPGKQPAPMPTVQN